MSWAFYTKLLAVAGTSEDEKKRTTAKVLSYEFERLNKQKCAYCSGFGHSGDDCPTDAKISLLRGGILEATCIISEIRKQLREDANMAGVTGFSLLSAEEGRLRSKKRGRVEMSGYQTEPNNFSRKRFKF